MKKTLMIKLCSPFLHAQLYHVEAIYACIVRVEWAIINPVVCRIDFGDTEVLISYIPNKMQQKHTKTVCLAQGTDKGDNIKLWMPPNSRCKRCDIQDKGKSQHQWASNDFFWSWDWHTRICIHIYIYMYMYI